MAELGFKKHQINQSVLAIKPKDFLLLFIQKILPLLFFGLVFSIESQANRNALCGTFIRIQPGLLYDFQAKNWFPTANFGTSRFGRGFGGFSLAVYAYNSEGPKSTHPNGTYFDFDKYGFSLSGSFNLYRFNFSKKLFAYLRPTAVIFRRIQRTWPEITDKFPMRNYNTGFAVGSEIILFYKLSNRVLLSLSSDYNLGEIFLNRTFEDNPRLPQDHHRRTTSKIDAAAFGNTVQIYFGVSFKI